VPLSAGATVKHPGGVIIIIDDLVMFVVVVWKISKKLRREQT